MCTRFLAACRAECAALYHALLASLERGLFPHRVASRRGECPLCLEEGTIFTTACCQQTLCSVCVEEWYRRRSRSCPYCRHAPPSLA